GFHARPVGKHLLGGGTAQPVPAADEQQPAHARQRAHGPCRSSGPRVRCTLPSASRNSILASPCGVTCSRSRDFPLASFNAITETCLSFLPTNSRGAPCPS